jgi:Uma2 family endonuclease
MRPEERARVVESLPNQVTYDEMAMPEGDKHSRAKIRTLDVLQHHFSQERRKVYLGTELPVYYPGEPRFAPDLLAVLDAESHERGKWVVSHEGKGLDWVMEVHVGGDRKKDAEYNVRRYARLGIAEYFIYDRSKERLEGYRLRTPGARQYTRMRPVRGRYVSRVLGLELEVREGQLRLWAGRTLLLESAEMLERLRGMVDKVQQRVGREARRRRSAERLLAEEVRQRKAAERRVAKLQAELERLRAH